MFRIYTTPAPDDRFLVFEGHSVSGDIIMSNTLPVTPGDYVNSSDPALVSLCHQLDNKTEDIGVYITNNHHTHIRIVVR